MVFWHSGLCKKELDVEDTDFFERGTRRLGLRSMNSRTGYLNSPFLNFLALSMLAEIPYARMLKVRGFFGRQGDSDERRRGDDMGEWWRGWNRNIELKNVVFMEI